MATEVDEFFATADQWADEMAALRSIVLGCDVVEAWKWKQPCYTHRGKNVAIISPFKQHCGLGFFQGVLLDDPEGLLVAPGKDSQSSRQLRFTSVAAVEESADTIAAFVRQAMGHVEAGTTVEFSARDELELPDELVAKFSEVDGLEAAFMALTPGRQRGFVLNIAGAKQSATRAKRVDKHLDRILAGKGIHDCICGRSARMPRCDGSHSRT